LIFRNSIALSGGSQQQIDWCAQPHTLYAHVLMAVARGLPDEKIAGAG
jgi:hypothetical protein